MPKLRFILEFDVSNSPITPALATYAWGGLDDQDELVSGLAHERRLAAVVDAHPDLLRQSFLNQMLSGFIYDLNSIDLKGLSVNEAMAHARLSLVPLVLARVPEAERAALEHYCQEAGLLAPDGGPGFMAEWRTRAELTRVLVEDEQGVMATSDERTRRYKKRRR